MIKLNKEQIRAVAHKFTKKYNEQILSERERYERTIINKQIIDWIKKCPAKLDDYDYEFFERRIKQNILNNDKYYASLMYKNYDDVINSIILSTIGCNTIDDIMKSLEKDFPIHIKLPIKKK